MASPMTTQKEQKNWRLKFIGPGLRPITKNYQI
jgi:hypothetical protein